ncbi:MAG: DNA polymerase III subunit gamma/tau [Actinomycetota bacterium]|nr:DNA polymerase III subunit gamma/tau [Actinomycetota bacterium]
MLSLYRRHRPRTFSEVVGQEHIVKTLRNAIELGKVHHAYLFVGSRGTGKTSVAKLLACALNAEGGPSADFDPDAPGCRSIMLGTSLDVVEMDAASNNSVDDIRELRENVALAPMGGSRRVYILDEAHMLTPAAWNAFLKTLEEPPPHVVFVLATTEAHKVPATIVDRCHQFRFHRPSLGQVVGVVRRVAEQEDIQVPDAAAGMIARSATGSFRDALGTLEQLVTYGGKELALDDVLEVLGVADASLVLDTTEALADHDPKAALLAVRRLADSGRDFERFMRDLTAHLRHLYEIQILGEVPESFSVTAEHTDRLSAQAERLSQAELLRAIDLLAAALAAVKEGSEPLIQLEVALLKATQPQADASLQALMFRIEQLESRLAGSAAGSQGEGGEDPRAAALPPQDSGVVATEAPLAGAARNAGPVAAAAALVEEPAPQPISSTLSFDRICELWPALCEAVRESNEMVAAVLLEARPSSLEDEKLTVAFAEGAAFMRKKAETNADLLRGALRGLTGRSLALGFELGGSVAAPAVLNEEQLIERLKANLAAEEVFDDDQEDT